MARSYEKLVAEAEAHHAATAVPTRAEQIAASADRLHRNAEPHFRRVRYPVGAVLETVNLALAIKDFLGDLNNARMREQRTWSLVGASADMASFVADFMAATRQGLGKRVLTGAGGAAGFVGGACQMVDEERQMVEGYARHDYGIAVGHGIAAAGAAMTAVGGGMLLVQAISGGALFGGPIGAVVAGIGACLIIGGNLLAMWLTSNEYEQFARACFLGRGHDEETAYPDWAVDGIPTRSILQEARVLVGLLATFKLRRQGSGSPWPIVGNGRPESFLDILPGYLTHEAQLEVTMEQGYGFGGWGSTPTTFESVMRFNQETDQMEYVRGTMVPVLNHLTVTRDEGGAIERIRLPLRPLSVNTSQGAVLFDRFGLANSPLYCKVKVRVQINNVWLPPGGDWVQINTMDDEEVTSLDASARVP